MQASDFFFPSVESYENLIRSLRFEFSESMYAFPFHSSSLSLKNTDFQSVLAAECAQLAQGPRDSGSS